ncbi:VOC family protein [Propionibacterium freudenreichii]|uniref:VOC family protein n=1 Tax=Propionibacterium freudenreichii TaxID=1744 RepID=UPI00054425EB|nr:VOC family protein [Propionibacterium freudenreichii]MDK9320140.1 VOC family protein [Propionibacterium freudenreichii]MDK9344650.1 bleomycin resistance protein [Propionibacterium freudenreichii]MDK9593253.1 bleomycin resistance protein [Propionibacterium freudenreichii]MDK9644117.1 VOC family protein [Propionibacterium freudenreichii]MDK9669301.1 VOC family protein [Propionibacterium freudenreichii]
MNEQTRHTKTLFALDVVTLAGDPDASKDFYAAAFGPLMSKSAGSVEVDMHGTGRFELASATTDDGSGGEGASSSFPGYVVTYALAQPSEVQAVMDTAAHAGAQVLKPAKKALFGSFSGSFRAPDGSIWKVAADSNKNKGPVAAAPRPTEISIILGVKDPKASRAFYQALGLKTDRDYGNKYIDFHPVDGAVRLCLMQRGVLAKDVGINDPGDGTGGLTLSHRAATNEDIEQLIAVADSSGSRSATPQAHEAELGSGHFADPDGFRWNLSTSK